jgi:hypothetical protein
MGIQSIAGSSLPQVWAGSGFIAWMVFRKHEWSAIKVSLPDLESFQVCVRMKLGPAKDNFPSTASNNKRRFTALPRH